MKIINKIISIFILIAISQNGFSQSLNDESISKTLPNDVPLTTLELKLLKESGLWQRGSKNIDPFFTTDGIINYPYGLSKAELVCGNLKLCVIYLETDENASPNDIYIGDPRVDSGVSLAGDHFVWVKPLSIGIDTNVVIATNKRTYNIDLKSNKSSTYEGIRFIYPKKVIAAVEKTIVDKEKHQQLNTLKTGEYLGDLDFQYKISGDKEYFPVRVFNDGLKTIIEMNDDTQSLPTLLIQDEISNEGVTNYRYINNRFVVDLVFDKASLVSGVGRKQIKTIIERIKK